jgi:anti-sigma factor RsiW
MLTCKQITELATAYTDGHLPLLDNLRFRLHLATCRHCRSYVRQLDITTRALRTLPEPEISLELTDALLRRFDGWKAGREAAEERRPAAQAPQPTFPTSTTSREGRARTAGSVLAALAAFGLLVGFASSRSPSAEDWAIALALAAAASALAALSSRFSLGVVVAAVSVAFAAALVRGGDGPLALSMGIHCLGAEIASAAAVAGTAWIALRPGPRTRARHVLAAAAAAGAVAADAALQVTCDAHGSLPHLLVFHVGGVVAAASAAMLLLRSRLRPAHS